MLGYLSADIICSEERTVFQESSSRKTVSYESGGYGGYCVYYPSNIFRNTHSSENFKNPRIFPSFSWEIFGPMTSHIRNHSTNQIARNSFFSLEIILIKDIFCL